MRVFVVVLYLYSPCILSCIISPTTLQNRYSEATCTTSPIALNHPRDSRRFLSSLHDIPPSLPSPPIRRTRGRRDVRRRAGETLHAAHYGNMALLSTPSITQHHAATCFNNTPSTRIKLASIRITRSYYVLLYLCYSAFFYAHTYSYSNSTRTEQNRLYRISPWS